MQSGKVFGLISHFRPEEIRQKHNETVNAEDLGYYACRNISSSYFYDFAIQKLCPTYPNYQRQHGRPYVKKLQSVQNFYFLLTILLSGDVSTNPGPVKYPCGDCHKPVRKNQHGIFCEDCNFWFHIKCIQMSIDNYQKLSESSEDWFCKSCILPPFTDSFFDANESMSTNPDSNTPENDCLPLSPDNTSDVNTEIFEELKEVRKRHPQQFMCSYLNVNSFRYKFCSIKELWTTRIHVDMLIIAETKLDDTFTNSQFEVDNYHLWRADRSSHGGGILVYLRSDLACDRKRKLECQFIESVFVEINFNKDKKFLVSGLYRPPTMSDEQFTKDFNKTFDKILMSYENIIILGDLNYNMMNKDKCVPLQTMCDIFDLENLVKSETCFKKMHQQLC